MFDVRCGACQQTFGARDQHRGKRVKCPKCGVPVDVPDSVIDGLIDLSEPPRERETRSVSRESASAKRPSHRPKSKWLAPFLGGFVLATILFILSALRSDHSKDRKLEKPGDSPAEQIVEESHSLDSEHPDYGAIVGITLLTRANKKNVQGGGLQKWFHSLTANEREAVILIRLQVCISSGEVERVINEGYGDEIRPLMRMLNDDINTPVSHAVAIKMRKLLPYVRTGITTSNGDEERYWIGQPEERETFLRQLNAELQPFGKALSKDMDHYFYRRWKSEGDSYFD